MRIKTKLRWNVLISISLGGFVALTLFYAVHRIGEATQKAQVADSIVKSVAELDGLTYDYIFHPEERPKEQWKRKHASLHRLLGEEPFQEERERNVVQRIKSNHGVLEQLFTQLVSHLEADANLTVAERPLWAESRERIVAQFIAKTQMMSDDAFLLSRASKQAIREVLRKSFLVVLASILLLIAAISGVSTFLEKTITRSLRRLREGTDEIAGGMGGGNLNHRIGMPGGDELGEFARSFDRMTERLQAVTVSKDELQKEVEERKRAEQILEKRTLELQELTRTLDQRVNERTAELEKSNAMLQAEMAERLRLVAAVEQAGEGIAITSPGGTIYYINPAFERNSGWTQGEIVGRNYGEFLPGEDLKRTVRDIRDRRETWNGHVIRGRDGKSPELDVTLSPIRDRWGEVTHYLAIERDVTQEVRLEQQLRQVQKMEALGTLAGGIAHDFNNLLAAIVINSELGLYDLGEESPVRNQLEIVLKSALRGKDLVRQMLLFSRRSEKKQEIIPLTPILKETFKLLRSSIPATIEMNLLLGAESDAVFGDPSQIQQVVMNLCTNAAHAMREKGGSIDISLESMALSPGDLPEEDMHPGDYLVFSVKDTGHGMDKQIVKRIFEPFFTTKPVGEGTGLGLSVAYGIVKAHRGGIAVYSEPGRGSIFKVYLPMANAAAAAERKAPEPIPRGTETVLVVDDEEYIIRSVKNMLEHLGYRVTACTDSEEACRMFSEDPFQFDLVITDQTMPCMTGEDLGRKLLSVRPGIPIILCTGYSDLISSQKATAMGFQGFMMKPFTVREASQLIRRVLDQKKPLRQPGNGNQTSE